MIFFGTYERAARYYYRVMRSLSSFKSNQGRFCFEKNIAQLLCQIKIHRRVYCIILSQSSGQHALQYMSFRNQLSIKLTLLMLNYQLHCLLRPSLWRVKIQFQNECPNYKLNLMMQFQSKSFWVPFIAMSPLISSICLNPSNGSNRIIQSLTILYII